MKQVDIVPIIIVALIVGVKLFEHLKDYMLKKEKIKAEALIQCEQLRLKNQIELEKLIQKDQVNKV